MPEKLISPLETRRWMPFYKKVLKRQDVKVLSSFYSFKQTSWSQQKNSAMVLEEKTWLPGRTCELILLWSPHLLHQAILPSSETVHEGDEPLIGDHSSHISLTPEWCGTLVKIMSFELWLPQFKSCLWIGSLTDATPSHWLDNFWNN